jgi:hypothetical protein
MISRDALRKYEGMEPEEIAKAEGLEILEVDDMPTRLEDVFCLGTIVIRKGLSAAERRWRIGHCLGHHFLHVGNRREGSSSGPVRFSTKEEREADIFAGYLEGALISPDWFRKLYIGMEPWKLEPWEILGQLRSGLSSLEKTPGRGGGNGSGHKRWGKTALAGHK